MIQRFDSAYYYLLETLELDVRGNLTISPDPMVVWVYGSSTPLI